VTSAAVLDLVATGASDQVKSDIERSAVSIAGRSDPIEIAIFRNRHDLEAILAERL